MALYRAHYRLSLVEDSGVFDNPFKLVPRTPVSMSPVTHKLCGEWFQDTHQIDYRSRAIFCTGDIKQAKTYLSSENVLIEVWPLGSYRLCFSERIRDLFEHLKCGFFQGDSNSSEEVRMELDSLGYQSYIDGGLHIAENSGCEVMIIADSYGYRIVKDHS